MSLENEKPNFNTYSLRPVHLLLIASIFLIVPAGAIDLDSLNNSCINCHKNISPETNKKAADFFQLWVDSGHSNYYVTCEACHGGDAGENSKSKAHSTMKNVTDPESQIYFKNVPEKCGKCHEEELDHFRNTMHYERLRAESRAPSCVTCHSPHSFKVLKASELTPLCSFCHNDKDKIASASVPGDAMLALEKATILENEIVLGKNAISEAKANGKDVSSAQNDLDKAIAVLKEVPSLWHSFNLKVFDTQIQSGIDSARKSQNKLSTTEPTVPSVPGTGIFAMLGIIFLSYIVRKW